MKKIDANKLENGQVILSTERIDEIIRKDNMGMPLKRSEHIWFNKISGVRKAKLPFAMTRSEMEEYTKCKLSPHYFAEHYCNIKREDGTVGEIKLRNYQKDILSLYTDNRYSILMASRQTGKCVHPSTKICIMRNGNIFETTIGELYLNELKKTRKLTILENIKLLIFKIYPFFL